MSNTSRIVPALLMLLGACGSQDDESEAGDDAANHGDVEFRFTVGNSVRGSSNLVDPLQGYVYGGIFRSADVTIMGPRDGAEQQDAIVVEGVDLEAAEITAPMWTSTLLEPGNYAFLGYFDVDASSKDAADRDPEDGDPVTLPSANTFEVVAGETTMVEVRFDLVL